MGVGVRAEDEARVVRDVQPLVGVGGPRVGALDAPGEMSRGRACSGPQPERAVHVHPGTGLAGHVADGVEGIYGAGVDVTGLCADYGWSRGLLDGCPEGVGAHAALLVSRDRV